MRPVALVLGAAVRADGTPSPSLALRVDHAVALYRAGRVGAICVAGGVGRHGPAEGTVGRARARAAGVPDADLIVEVASRNTAQNIANARSLLAGRPVVIVSHRWHLPRAWLAARLLGLTVTASGPRGQLSWPRAALAILREAAATPLTALRALRLRWARRSGR
ncbi:YdcF family protein [Jannaschia sp. M317]|uniref:YdcF family protein n=1 Tax=Jannaschia sp. M317 TaxID=2867011 RepID=UPI0021A890F8|nr:YdcF family protein [Jannaschia sp. M317]